MKRTEAPLTTAWIKWARHNLTENFIAEVKWCPKGKFYFSSSSFAKELRCLSIAKHGILINKQSDIAGLGTLCDVWGLNHAKAWLILFFDKKKFYAIEVDAVQMWMSGHKSINEQEAKNISDFVGELK